MPAAQLVNRPASCVEYQSMARDVLREALDAIEGQWVRLGAPIASHLRPGLAGQELDELAAACGWALPPELRTWWGWHDGTDSASSLLDIGPGGFWFFSAERAFRETQEERQIAPDDADNPGWRHSWLKFMPRDASRLYADCAHFRFSTPGYLPIGLVPKEWDGADVPVARSLTQVALMWLWLLEHDHYAVDDSGVLNEVESNPVPQWIMWTDLV
jgi:hypothetical protein